jgi:CHAD domain-containing protein
MPPAPPTCAFSLPARVGADDVVAVLSGRFDVVEDRPETVDRTAYDTADRRLRDAGVELTLERRRDGPRLVLQNGGPPDAEAPVTRRGRYFAGDLPGGAVRDRVAPLIEVRALVPLVRLRSRVRHLRVRNADHKTVARLAVEHAEAVERGRPPAPLAPRVHLRGVLGYDKPYARVERAVTAELGLVGAGRILTDDALAQLGHDPVGIRTKVQVDLAPAMRADRATVAILVALADVAEANLRGALDDVDSEFLHDLRVAIRRARSVLRQHKQVLPPSERERFRTDLRWIQAVTGPTRDLDVLLLQWDELAAELPEVSQSDLDPLHELLVSRRVAARRALRRHLRGSRFQESWAAWRSFLAADLGPEEDRPDGARPLREVAGGRIGRVHRRMVMAGGAIDDGSPAEALHELRKQGKELRYLLELFGALWPPEVVKPMVGALKGLQDVLGRHQDCDVQAATFRGLAHDLVSAQRGADAVLALGIVVERLRERQAAARGEFAERFAAFASREQRALVRETFRAQR